MRPHVIFLLAAASISWLGACSSGPPVGCVIPPPAVALSERDTAIAIASELQNLPGGGELDTEFQETIELYFNRLSDPNDSLYLFLKAIECYLEQGEVGAAVAHKMADGVRTWWAAENGIHDTEGKLTPEERAIINKSRNALWIYSKCRLLGME